MTNNNPQICDIAVLDSGVLSTHRAITSNRLSTYAIIDHDGLCTVEEEGGTDTVGHGTAIISILQKQTRGMDVQINSYKILSNDNEGVGCDLDVLLFTLNYILHHVTCKIIHMSFGVRYHSEELRIICQQLTLKGIILISAFDNGGAISYPAAYDNVIGVDASLMCLNSQDFVTVENSAINIKAKGGNQRVAWVNPEYVINQGSSFAAPYVTANVLRLLKEGLDISAILQKFDDMARYRYRFEMPCTMEKPEFHLDRVAVFPYNKEINSFVNYSEMLTFKLVDIFDIRQSGRVGQSAKDIDGTERFIIKNIDEIDCSAIDTLVLGHIKELEIYTKKEYKRNLLNMCLENKLNVYSLDSYLVDEYRDKFIKNSLFLHYPEVNKHPSFLNNFGRLHKIKTPVVGIMGTTMQQGKFTLQLTLKKLFTQHGYKVGHLATEPSGLLFGCDEVYPFGYAGTVTESETDMISHVNELMHLIDIKEPEIILAGSQSGTTPLMFENIANIYTTSINFLLGIQPDAVILCVNIFDDIAYIERTINTITGLVQTDVIALALYPLMYPNNWYHLKGSRVYCDNGSILKFIEEVKQRLDRNVFVMNKEGYADLFHSCINYFSQ